MTTDNVNTSKGSDVNLNAWFDDMVARLRIDEALLENDMLDEGKREVYGLMAENNMEALSNLSRQQGSFYFITNMVKQYLSELSKRKAKPEKLGLELSDSKILVWAEVSEDNEELENSLILAEAKVNAYFSKFGFHISSTIVEDCDGLEIPSHYKSVAIA